MRKLKIIVTFSGGKDSLAALIWAIFYSGYKLENIIAVFCDTGFEHEYTYLYIKEITNKLGVKLVVLKSKRYNDFLDLSIKKKRFPSTKARFCTEELKTKPMIDFILDECNCHVVVVQGIRAKESKNRSLMSKQCTYFKYYTEPYKRNDWLLETKQKQKQIIQQRGGVISEALKNEILTLQGKVDRDLLEPKYHTYRKKEVLAFREKYLDDVIRPVFEYTAQEVLNYILKHDLKPNPLYYFGMGRVGCFPCIMVNKKELFQIIKKFPERIEKLKEYESLAGKRFFPPNFIPERYMTHLDKKTNKKIPTIDDVVKYVIDINATGKLFEIDENESDRRCMSFYNICE